MFHNLEDLPPHLTIFGEDVALLCGHSNCPLTTVIHNFDRRDKVLDLVVILIKLPFGYSLCQSAWIRIDSSLSTSLYWRRDLKRFRSLIGASLPKEELRNIKFHSILAPSPQILKSFLFKNETFVNLLGETFVPDLLQVTEGQDLQAAEGKGHDAGLVGRAGRPPLHDPPPGQLATNHHQRDLGQLPVVLSHKQFSVDIFFRQNVCEQKDKLVFVVNIKHHE